MPHKNGGWQVKRDGGKRASHVEPTKAGAEKKAREISRNQDTELQVHGQDGSIQRSDSDGKDPRGGGSIYRSRQISKLFSLSGPSVSTELHSSGHARGVTLKGGAVFGERSRVHPADRPAPGSH